MVDEDWGTVAGDIDYIRVEDLDELGRAEWDSLVGPAAFYQSYDWLRGQQNSPSVTAGYLVGRSGGHHAVQTPVYDYGPGGFPLPEQLRCRHPLLVGGRTGYHNELLADSAIDAGSGPGGHLVGSLVDELGDYALGRGHDALLFDQLTTSAARRLVASFGGGYLQRPSEAFIDVPRGTFDTYVRGAAVPRSVRHEYAHFKKSGLRIETSTLRNCLDEVAGLVFQTLVKYGVQGSVDGVVAFLREQARYVNDASVVFRCLDEAGRAVGCSICFRWERTLYARVAGFDYARLRNAFEYFATGYYSAVEYMQDHGLEVLSAGVGSLDAKVRRGARLESLWACLVPLPVRRGRMSPLGPTELPP